jgi:hypothetical protein
MPVSAPMTVLIRIADRLVGRNGAVTNARRAVQSDARAAQQREAAVDAPNAAPSHDPHPGQS